MEYLMRKLTTYHIRIVITGLCIILLLAACSMVTIHASPLQIVPVDSPTSTLPTATTTVTPGETSTAVPTTSPTTTAGCDTTPPISVGTSADMTIAVNPQEAKAATTRSYRLHIPANYQPQLPLPVVLIFHGRGSSPAEI